ncbi:TetR/AcrR family transcriptional regulator [Cryptosporangium sp. NPDC048952]|uniref:TetR/AcrR family transcriptional regulator n=1 Tax=Cryptosporangium sp. NPDC048952 TaxID=3363961 RepID=UPI0037148682
MTRQDRKPRQRLDPSERRESLLSAAASEFREHGYADTAVSAIAARADASEALLYRYFTSKDQLYAELVRRAIDELLARQADAVRALPDGVPVRDRLRATTLVYLDHIAGRPAAWAIPFRRPGGEPPAAAAVRAEARREYVERLRGLLSSRGGFRHEFALWGYFGFLDAACLHWVDEGCPEDARWSLIDAALGALEGALGDWDA